jgi:hypothetical protein
LVLGLEIIDVGAGRLDRKVDERRPDRGVPKHRDGRVAVHEVRHIFRADQALVIQEMGGIRGLEVGFGGIHDVGDEDRIPGRRLVAISVFAGDEGDRRFGQRRGDIHQPVVLPLVIVLVQIGRRSRHGHQGLGTVGEGIVKLILSGPAFLEKDQDEMKRQVFPAVRVIAPDLARPDAEDRVESLGARRLPEDDMEPPPVRHPAGPPGPSTEVLVGVLEPLDMFVLVLVGRRAGGRIAELPEALDEEVPVPVVRQLQKNFFFLGGDDIAHQGQVILVRDGQVLFGELCRGARGLSRRGDGSGHYSEDEGNRRQ